MKTFSLGYSPCPNDTFIFHGLVHGLVETALRFEPPVLDDVETLNTWAMDGRLDITKLSFHALGHVLDQYCLLQSGGALGRGCGPLLVSAGDVDLSRQASLTVAIPGKYTTAAMLFRMFAPQCTNLVQLRFETIMENVASGRVDAGVIIHESRFTYEQYGLRCVQDLGNWWEETTGQPIPLGCIAARRSLGRENIEEIERVIKKSLERAYENPQECLPYVRKFAQEIDEEVMRNHIDLYVNEYSLNLGHKGMKAVEMFLHKGRAVGILPQSDLSLTVR